MNRHVIILAQGQQTRLPDLPCPKQMMRLPWCEGMAIIGRTLLQVNELDKRARMTVVSPMLMTASIIAQNWSVPIATRVDRAFDGSVFDGHELADPGNSSIKGVARYLDHRADMDHLCHRDLADQTVVLLGDCVYSWSCLEQLFSTDLPYQFVGTSNLSESTGEIWGISWISRAQPQMLEWLRKALRRHPPFPRYQCGQLRQWLFTARRDADEQKPPTPVYYADIDDYTKDFDVPADLDHLHAVSERARDDDMMHGLVWGG